MHEEYIRKIFNECNVGRLLGIEVSEVREGFAKGRLVLKPEHINVFGSVHGGIVFTFADHVGGACGNSIGKKSLLVESSVQFMKGASAGETLYCEALYIHRSKKIGRIDIKIYNEKNELIALMHMVSYISNVDHSRETQ